MHFDHCMLLCEKFVLSMMFNAICPFKTATWHVSETKIKGCHTIFCITLQEHITSCWYKKCILLWLSRSTMQCNEHVSCNGHLHAMNIDQPWFNCRGTELGCDARKPVFGVSDKARLNLQRLARKLRFRLYNVVSLDMVLSKKGITKALIRLLGCAGWSAPLLFKNHRRQVFSRRSPDTMWHFGHQLSSLYKRLFMSIVTGSVVTYWLTDDANILWFVHLT